VAISTGDYWRDLYGQGIGQQETSQSYSDYLKRRYEMQQGVNDKILRSDDAAGLERYRASHCTPAAVLETPTPVTPNKVLLLL